ncbi:MAG TPA: cobalamin biosynthesis protein [Thermodesulfobacteriota bacterium]|nr:cobalamin biosynthesis protein [Thermodesulfobacteriota bacterium]
MKIALITLSDRGADVVATLREGLPGAKVFLHEEVLKSLPARRFSSILELTGEIFNDYEGLVYAAPCGVAVRAVAPHLKDKRSDPAVVVVDAGGRHAISLLSGHEGGANDLAVRVSNLLGAEPVITTTTEALKSVIVGIGCRRGVAAGAVRDAVRAALERAAVNRSEVRLLASADIKSDERGLIDAAAELGIPLRFISSEEIRSCPRAFGESARVKEKVNLPAVAEPAALLAGRRTRLILPRTTFGGITVAVARENFSWSESARETL